MKDSLNYERHVKLLEHEKDDLYSLIFNENFNTDECLSLFAYNFLIGSDTFIEAFFDTIKDSEIIEQKLLGPTSSANAEPIIFKLIEHGRGRFLHIVLRYIEKNRNLLESLSQLIYNNSNILTIAVNGGNNLENVLALYRSNLGYFANFFIINADSGYNVIHACISAFEEPFKRLINFIKMAYGVTFDVLLAQEYKSYANDYTISLEPTAFALYEGCFENASFLLDLIPPVRVISIAKESLGLNIYMRRSLYSIELLLENTTDNLRVINYEIDDWSLRDIIDAKETARAQNATDSAQSELREAREKLVNLAYTSNFFDKDNENDHA